MKEFKVSYRFRKNEKLCSEKKILQLFKDGKSIKSDCIRLIYYFTDEKQDPVVQVLIAVPKKLFKNAVIRNRLKRRLREAYRLNKMTLINRITPESKSLYLAILYQSSVENSYPLINESLRMGLNKLSELFWSEE